MRQAWPTACSGGLECLAGEVMSSGQWLPHFLVALFAALPLLNRQVGETQLPAGFLLARRGGGLRLARSVERLALYGLGTTVVTGDGR